VLGQGMSAKKRHEVGSKQYLARVYGFSFFSLVSSNVVLHKESSLVGCAGTLTCSIH
jgi:hypothetical protein